MRLRVCVLACVLATLGSFTAAGLASAAPKHNHGLTIAATPNPVPAGQGVVIYGHLAGPDSGGQTIRLYHHVIGSGDGYTQVATTTTDPNGFYEFIRPEGLVYTNRDWFVRGPDGVHSRTVHELVIALVSITASTTDTDTNHAVVFSGHVTPNHQFEQVFLEQRIDSSDDWRTLRSTTLDPGSNYYVAYRWRRPGVHEVRVVFRGDVRNLRGVSEVETITVEQAQVPGFTINTTSPIVPTDGSVTISGSFSGPGGTPIQLWGRTPDHRFVVLANGFTKSDGSYSFSQSDLTTNTIYYVATVNSPRRHTALLYQGVRDVVTMSASQMSTTTDSSVTFTGTVLPDKAGHVIYLEQLGNDGDWHIVEAAIVQHDSTFQFSWSMGSPGTYEFRARIFGDEDNIGSASPPVSVTATAPAAQVLPSAS